MSDAPLLDGGDRDTVGPVLKVENLTKRYGTLVAVDQVTFAIAPGSVAGLLGPNGSGKTTTLRVVLGLEMPTSGTASILGNPIERLAHPLQRIGALLNAGWVHPNRSARAHLTWLCQASRISTSIVDWALEEVGLAAVADNRAGTFSLGMKQRLGLASTILGTPDLLVLDEPMNALDPEGVDWMRGFMARRAEEGCAILVASHHLREIESTADRVLVMANGQLRFDGPPANLRAGTGVAPYVEVACADPIHAASTLHGTTFERAGVEVVADDEGMTVLHVQTDDVGGVSEALHLAGVAVHRVERRSSSLQEAYSALVRDHRHHDREVRT